MARKKVSEAVERDSSSDSDKLEVGKKIRHVRDNFDWTLDELSEATKQIDPEGVGVSKVSISRYENGDSYPGYREIKLIALTLGCPVSYFFYGEKPDPYGDWHMSLDEYLRSIVRDELIEAGLVQGKSMREKESDKRQAMRTVAFRRKPLKRAELTPEEEEKKWARLEELTREDITESAGRDEKEKKSKEAELRAKKDLMSRNR